MRGTLLGPGEADTPLVVDADRVLAAPAGAPPGALSLRGTRILLPRSNFGPERRPAPDQNVKSFLVLFFKKELLSSLPCLRLMG
jgi:hypothetical protein